MRAFKKFRRPSNRFNPGREERRGAGPTGHQGPPTAVAFLQRFSIFVTSIYYYTPVSGLLGDFLWGLAGPLVVLLEFQDLQVVKGLGLSLLPED